MKSKKNELIATLVLLSMGLLAACKEETKSYDWYLDNKEDAYRVYEKCQKSGDGSDNCENARRAYNAHERAKQFGYSLK
ncbi:MULTISPECIES: EexN family lipoprotein [Morganellaceae]|nr:MULTISPECIES: EexN family lipoprotein [Morganellaceae]HED3204457.1 EexN family lipoprotein [Kluyvera ascorbata]HED3269266.1 EexN family lipoprotein [Klebsiella pneumoniae]MBG3138979.1 EexN family lipoprotein [Proteus mirabilis]MBS3832933.1 EexN family lipoprotein [Proteus mirabilis]MCT0075389.1 EexN family lipoprotein [Proteus mirabilis]